MFESTLEAQGLHGSDRRCATVSAVAAIHAMVALAAFAASFLYVQELPDLPIRLEFTPPPRIVLDLGPARGPGAHKGGGSSIHPVAPPRIIPPTVTPPTVETPPHVDEIPETQGSGDGEGRGQGDSTGDSAGLLDEGPPGTEGSGDAPEGPVLLSTGMERPVLIAKVEPVYPPAARLARLQGRVIVQAVIGLDGTVESVEIMSSTSTLFDAAALDAVRRWRYRPATMDGRPVRVYFTVVVEFVIR